MARVLEAIQYPVYEVGEYPAELTRVVETKARIASEDGTFKDQYRFTWTLLDEDGNLTADQIDGWANQVLGPRAKYPKWYEGHTGRKAEPPVDVDDCIGKRVILSVDVYQKNDGSDGNSIEKIRPLNQPRPIGPRRAAPAPRPADDGQLGRAQAAPATDADPWEEESV